MYPACNAHALYCHLWPVRIYNIFPHYLINGTIFEEKILLNTKCVFWFSLQRLSETFLILRRNERDTIENVCRCSCKVPDILFRSYWHFIFLARFLQKVPKCKISWKSLQCESSCSMRADRRTDMTNQIVAFRNFANAPKNGWWRRPWSRAWILCSDIYYRLKTQHV